MNEYPNKLISSRAFTYFLKLAETLNYTKAAKLLNISQPALTQQIKKMEANLGTPLFYMSGKLLHLTEAGEIMKNAVDNIYEVILEATENIQRESSETAGKITIGISASVEDKIFTDFIVKYYDLFPEVEITLLMVGRKEIWEFIEKNRIDIAILYLPREILSKWQTYESKLVLEDEILFLHHDPKLKSKKSISYKESLEHPWVTYPKTYFVSQVIQEAFQLQEYGMPESVAHFTKPNQMFKFSNETGTYTALPRSFFQAHEREGELKAIPFSPAIMMDLAFIYKKDKLNVPRIQHFFDTFDKYIEDEDYISRLKK